MSDLTVFIDDTIRDERVRLSVNMDQPVGAVTEWYVDQFGLPRRDFDLSRIEYRLVRTVSETYLSSETTLRQAGIAAGELLQLVSPEGRRVWGAVQRLLDEIESQIKDRITGEIKDGIVEEVWDRITQKLDQIEKTRTGGRRVEQIREWVERAGGPAKVAEVGEKVAEVIGGYRATSTGRGMGAAGKAAIAALAVGAGVTVVAGSVVLLAVILQLRAEPVHPEATERPTATARAAEQDTQPPTQRPSTPPTAMPPSTEAPAPPTAAPATEAAPPAAPTEMPIPPTEPPTETPVPPPTSAPFTTFRLVNTSPHTICWFYLFAEEDVTTYMEWGVARINPDDPLYSPGERTFEVKPNVYRLLVEDCDDQMLDEQYGIAIAGDEFRWEIFQ